jgi:hypothetical protein
MNFEGGGALVYISSPIDQSLKSRLWVALLLSQIIVCFQGLFFHPLE